MVRGHPKVLRVWIIWIELADVASLDARIVELGLEWRSSLAIDWRVVWVGRLLPVAWVALWVGQLLSNEAKECLPFSGPTSW